MKKLKLFAILGVFALLFSSCEEEYAFLLGKWNIDELSFSFVLMGEEYTQTMTNQGWLEFKEGGSGTDSDGGSFDWELSGDDLTITDSETTFTIHLTTKEDEKIVGEWSQTETIEGIQLTIDYTIELSKL